MREKYRPRRDPSSEQDSPSSWILTRRTRTINAASSRLGKVRKSSRASLFPVDLIPRENVPFLDPFSRSPHNITPFQRGHQIRSGPKKKACGRRKIKWVKFGLHFPTRKCLEISKLSASSRFFSGYFFVP